MRNALGAVQSLLVLGGASDIGAAVAEQPRAATAAVGRAGRPPPRRAWSPSPTGSGRPVPRWPSPRGTPPTSAATPTRQGRVGGPARRGRVRRRLRPARRRRARRAGPPRRRPHRRRRARDRQLHRRRSSTLLHVGRRLQEQGHGTIVVLSLGGRRARPQVELRVRRRPRPALDGFSQGLGDSLAGTGVDVMVVPPGLRAHVDDRGQGGRRRWRPRPRRWPTPWPTGWRRREGHVWVPGTFRYADDRLPPPAPPGVAQGVRRRDDRSRPTAIEHRPADPPARRRPPPAGDRRRAAAEPTSLVVGLVKLARPKQWAKNVLVFAAPGGRGRARQPRVGRSTPIDRVRRLLPGRRRHLLHQRRPRRRGRPPPPQEAQPAGRVGRGAGAARLRARGRAAGRRRWRWPSRSTPSWHATSSATWR